MASEHEWHMNERAQDLQKSMPKLLVNDALSKCGIAANHEMKLNGASVLWSKITRAKGILHEALALKGHGNG